MRKFLDGIQDSLDDLREEIEEKLDEIEFEKLSKERGKYYTLRDNVKSIMQNMKNALNNINSVSKKVIDGYSVNEKSADDGYLENKRKDIQATYDYLNNNVLPAIEKKITEISDEIEKI